MGQIQSKPAKALQAIGLLCVAASIVIAWNTASDIKDTYGKMTVYLFWGGIATFFIGWAYSWWTRG